MRKFPELPSAPSDHPVPFTDQLRLALAAYLARFKGTAREHTQSNLRHQAAGLLACYVWPSVLER
jgi:hypothetical protein